MNQKVAELLQSFLPVSLTELEGAALQNRYDVKYIIPENLLPELLNDFSEYYQILEIDGVREFEYTSWYYDTDDFRLYNDHHNGYGGRMKIRKRKYENSGDVFFEIKKKIEEIKTDKIRVPVTELSEALEADQLALIETTRFDTKRLTFKLSNTFDRITLSNSSIAERVTIDKKVCFDNGINQIALPGIVLMEVKQGKISTRSAAITFMKKHHIFESSFSKYAFGAASLFPHLKQNNIKPLKLRIQKYASS